MSAHDQEFKIRNFIHGEWVEESGVEMVPLYNPSTGGQIGEVPLSSEKTALECIDSAYSAYDPWRKLALSKRMTYIFDLRQAIIDQEEELCLNRI